MIPMPTTFNDIADEAALRVIEQAFPKRSIVPFPTREMVVGLGAVHCVTLPEPQRR